MVRRWSPPSIPETCALDHDQTQIMIIQTTFVDK